MKVYRYLSKKELNSILDENYGEIGNIYDDKCFKRVNSHRYSKGVRYLHFYKHREDVSHMQSADFLPSGDYYICEFDIPVMMLIGRAGYGFYGHSGYYGDNLKEVREFVLPAKYMKKKFLRSYTLDKSHQSPLYDGALIGFIDVKKGSQLRFSDIAKIKEEDKEQC